MDRIDFFATCIAILLSSSFFGGGVYLLATSAGGHPVRLAIGAVLAIKGLFMLRNSLT